MDWNIDILNKIGYDNQFTTYKNMVDVSDKDAAKEFKEEINTEAKSNAMNRWEMSNEEATAFFKDADTFVELVKDAKIETLTPNELMKVWNYSQVTKTIEMALAGEEQEYILDNSIEFYSQPGMTTDLGKYTKISSFERWLDIIENEEPVEYPLLLLKDNKYYHITGHTRQSAATTLGYILPVKVITYGS